MQLQPGRDNQERAAAALNLVDGGGDSAAHELLQRRKTRAIRYRILLVLGSLIVGAASGVAFGHRGATMSHGSSVAHWRTVAGPALLIAGVLLEVVVFVARFRSGQFRAGWRSPSLVLSRGQRRQILKQIRGRIDVDESMLPVSRHLAELLRRQRSLIALLAAVAMITFGQALPHNVPFRWWLAIAVVVLLAVSSVQMFRDSSRAERFLQQTKQHSTSDQTQPIWPVGSDNSIWPGGDGSKVAPPVR